MVRSKTKHISSPEKNILAKKGINKSLEKENPQQNAEDMNRSRRKSMAPLKKYRMRGDPKDYFMNGKLLRQIRILQNSTKNVLPFAPFVRLIREVLSDFGGPEMRIQRVALEGLQEACEMYMTQFFEDSYLITLHARRKTLNVKDMRLVRRLRGVDDIINH